MRKVKNKRKKKKRGGRNKGRIEGSGEGVENTSDISPTSCTDREK